MPAIAWESVSDSAVKGSFAFEELGLKNRLFDRSMTDPYGTGQPNMHEAGDGRSRSVMCSWSQRVWGESVRIDVDQLRLPTARPALEHDPQGM